MTTPDPATLCVILTGALGDFILALPALLCLRTRFPACRIDLVGNPSWLPLARQTPAVDRTVSMEAIALHEGFMPALSARHRLGRFLSSYERILSWFGDREGRFEKNLREALPGRTHVFPFHRQAAFPGHVSAFYLDTLRTLGIPCSDRTEATAPWPPSQRWDPFRTGAGGLSIHPGSGAAPKNWPAEQFRTVARHVRKEWRMPVRILLGPAEEAQRHFWEGTGESLEVLRGLSLHQLSVRLAHSALYLGNDSGVTHLAASLGVPTLALFGPTDPRRWAPRGPRVRVLRETGSAASSPPPTPLRPEGPRAPPAMHPEAVLLSLRELQTAETPAGEPP